MLKIKRLKPEYIQDSLKIILDARILTKKNEAQWLLKLSTSKAKHVFKPEYYVLFNNDKIVGISGLYQDYEVLNSVRWLDYLAVAPKLQRLGYGTMMLDNLEKICQKKRVKILCVFTDNKEAINFYKKHGFKIFGKINNYYSNGNFKVWLYKRLILTH